jgi:hypothetical protein
LVAICVSTAWAISCVASVVAQLTNLLSQFNKSVTQLLAYGGPFFFTELAIAVSVERSQDAFSRDRPARRIIVIVVACILCIGECGQCQHPDCHQRKRRNQMAHGNDLA